MIKRLLSILAASALALIATSLPAQTATQALVVATCGAPTYTAGTKNYITVDTTGNSCSSSAGGGGGSVTQGTTPWVVGQATASSLNAQVVGNIAHDGVDAGNPIKIGGKAFTGLPGLVANGDRVDGWYQGRGQLVLGGYGAAATDGVSNVIVMPLDQTDGSKPNGIAPFLFNGSTWDRQFTCTSQASVSVTAGNTTQIIALSGSTVIRICSANLGESLAGTFAFTSGTGSNCATPANAMAAIPLATSATFVSNGGTGSIYRGSAGGEFCITAATGNITGWVTYAQF